MKYSYLLSFAAFAFGTVACGASAIPQDESEDQAIGEETGESAEALSFKRSKRDYCCITKAAVGVLKCKRQRDYRDELGRTRARAQCEGWYATIGIDGTPGRGSGDPYGERTYDFVGATCDDRPECTQSLGGID